MNSLIIKETELETLIEVIDLMSEFFESPLIIMTPLNDSEATTDKSIKLHFKQGKGNFTLYQVCIQLIFSYQGLKSIDIALNHDNNYKIPLLLLESEANHIGIIECFIAEAFDFVKSLNALSSLACTHGVLQIGGGMLTVTKSNQVAKLEAVVS